MRIGEILRTKGHDVVIIGEERTVLDAVQRLVDHDIGGLVVTRGEAPVGIITERDVLRLTGRSPGRLDRLTVAESMTRDPITADPDTDLHDAMRLMTERRIRHLPVVRDGRLVGIVSIGDLLKASREVAEQENSHLRDYIQGAI